MKFPKIVLRSTKPLVALAENEVHVWRIEFDQFSSKLSTFANILSPDEQLRFNRYISPQAKVEFCICRSLLRIMLEWYGVGKAKDISFKNNTYGKPELGNPQELNGIQFNISHSGNFGLLVFSHHEIGVDVEEIRSLDFKALARTIFSNEELMELESLPVPQQRQAFFRGWTRKEAFIKGIGTGLNTPLTSFTVSLDDAPHVVHLPQIKERSSEWQLTDLGHDHRFAAAVAYLGKLTTIRLCQLELPMIADWMTSFISHESA